MLLTNLTIRGNVVRRVDITLIDLGFRDESVNIDCVSALDLNRRYLLILNNHVLAFCNFIAAHHVVPRDDLASFGIDILLFQPVARFAVDPIETHFFAKRRGGIKCYRARDQRKPKVTLPVRTRRHWILLNKMGQQIIWETLANACDPGELEHPQHSQHPPQHPLLTDGRVYRRLHPALSDSNA